MKCIAFQWPKAKVAGAWSGMDIEGYRSGRLYMRLIVCTYSTLCEPGGGKIATYNQ